VPAGPLCRLSGRLVTRARPDYYAVLGVPRDADGAIIKKAFRALASEFHPDVSEDPNAEARFREIAEAYEVLSRPETRERYDRRGHGAGGVSGFQHAPGGADGLFDDLFVPVAGSPRPGQPGADVVVEVEVDFLEAARGTSRGLRYDVVATCSTCRGEGTKPGGARRVCSACGGGGRAQEAASGPSGRLLRYRLCIRCRGSGRLVSNPCEDCGGLGRVEEERAILVSIPPGTEDGQRIRLPGEGHAGGPGGTPGDVYIVVRVPSPPDSPALRLLAGAGAVFAAVLLVVTLLAFH